MANEIVYYSSDETGAPTLNNAAGSMIGVLDACLVDGFNAKAVTSIVVASGVATATISAHGLLTGRIYEFSGSTVTGGAPGALNGRQKITVVDANTVTFPAPGVADQTATGTITGKRPSLGWAKQFTGTNKAVYQRTDPQATAMVLRVVDTGASPAAATYARAQAVETATDVDTFTSPAPTASQLPDGQYWQKGGNSATAKQWLLVGDSRTFYLFTDGSSYTFAAHTALHPQAFGDIANYRSGDAYHCFLAGSSTTNEDSQFCVGYGIGSAPTDAGLIMSRMSNQFGTAIPLRAPTFAATGSTFGGSSYPPYPSPVDNGAVIQRTLLVCEANATFSNPPRGHYRGVSVPLAAMPASLHRFVFTNVVGTTSEFLCVRVMGAGNPGAMLLDIAGPWN